MKRIILTITLLLVGMAFILPSVHAQSLSYYTTEYMRADASFAERLAVLEMMQEAGTQGTGEFYHNALSHLLLRAPDINSRNEQEAAEKSVIILSQALGAAKYQAATTNLRRAAEFFDIMQESTRFPNEGNAQASAIIAIGDVNGRDELPYIIKRLEDLNSQRFSNAEARRRVQTVVLGCVRALETLKDISGYRPVFFVYTGSYDAMIKQIAASALQNITDDPADVIIEIIRDPSITPPIKLEAWGEMLKTRAPNSSKARVAAAALDTSWTYTTQNRALQENLREMRKQAIDTIRQFGVTDSTVYTNLEKAYSSNFINNSPDYNEIAGALNALAAIRSDEAVELLYKFLSELHARRRSGPWRDKERQLFDWVVSCIGTTRTKNPEVRLLLMTIQRADQYTPHERNLAGNALALIGN